MVIQVEGTRNPNLSILNEESDLPNVVQQKFGETWWTGLAPELCSGFDARSQELKALPLLDLSSVTREKALDYFNNSWTLTELLFSGLKSELAFVRPPYHGLRHPLMFYYGHPAVLYVNKLRIAGLASDPVDLHLEKILETGVDEMSWDDMSKNEMIWPSLEQVHSYRKKVYQLVIEIIATHPDLDLKRRQDNSVLLNQDHPLWALFMGIEHEKIHFETSSVLMRELPIFCVEKPRYWPKLSADQVSNKAYEWIKKSRMTVTYGKLKDVSSYGWDNEYGSRTVEVGDFVVTDQLISNRDFFNFVESGAYIDERYWSQEGAMWRKFRNTKRPTFWVAHGPEGLHEYKLRTIFEIVSMPWSWPVEVNFHEALAFCNWRQEQDQTLLKYRLITEAEFQVLQQNANKDIDPVLTPDYTYNFNFQLGSPRSVSFDSSEIKDVMGNVWQWAMDHFSPLEGFKVHKYYDDFSTPCFDGKHQMILGGSFMSCGHEASKYARFHFRPHFFQHSGFRMAASCDGSIDNQAVKLRDQKFYIHTQKQETLKQTHNPNWWKNIDQPLELADQIFGDLVKRVTNLASHYWSQDFTLSNPIMGLAMEAATHKIKPDYFWGYQPSQSFPKQSSDIEGLLDFIFKEVSALGQKVGAPGYMGYVSGAAHPISILGQLVSHILNQYTAHHTMSLGMVTLEVEALKWFVDLVGYPSSSKALFTSGGSQANLQALVAARNQKLEPQDYLKARLYASSHVHHCIGKALAFLGFSKEVLRLVPVTEDLKMNTQILERMIQEDLQQGFIPFCIVGSIGTTNTGAVDSINDLLSIRDRYQLWLHLDGAYGFVFYLTESGKQLFGNLSEADSIAFDPHKGLQTPYGIGGLLVKEGATLAQDYAGQSHYMPPSPEEEGFNERTDFADYSLELSRDPRGLRVWLPIKMFGIEPYILNLQEKLILTKELYQELSQISKIEILCKPELTVTVFRLPTDKQTRDLMGAVNLKGDHFLSSTYIDDKLWIRVCLLGYRLHWAEVKSLIDTIHDTLSEAGT